MSLSELGYIVFRNACLNLPRTAIAAGLSSAVSYGINRFKPNTLLGVKEAALFTAVAVAAYKVFEVLTSKLQTKETKGTIQDLASRAVLFSIMAYGVRSIFNHEKTLASFAKLSVLSAFSFLSADYVANTIEL